MNNMAFVSGANIPDDTSTTHTTLSEILASIRRDRKWIVAGFAVPMAIAVVLAFTATPTYDANSTLLVRLGREYVYTAASPDGSNAQPMSFDRDQMLHSESAILTSEDVIAKVIADVGLQRLYPELAAAGDGKPDPMSVAIREVRKHLDAELVRDSNLIRVTFEHPDAKIAAEVVNRSTAAYLARRRAIFASSQTGFLQEQLSKARAQLADADKALSVFEHDHGIVSFDHQLSLLLDQRQTIELKLSSAREDSVSSTGQQNALLETLSTVPANLQLYTETSPGEPVNTARQRLLDLRLKERDLTSKYFDDDPLVIDVRKDISNVENFLAEAQRQGNATVRTGRNVVRDTVEAELARARGDTGSAKARQDALLSQLRDVEQRIDDLVATQTEDQNYQRTQKLAADNFTAYARKFQDSLDADAADQKAQTNVSIVQRASVPVERKSYRATILAIGFAASIFIALLVSFVVALIRETFTVPAGLERALGLPVLADIPDMSPRI